MIREQNVKKRQKNIMHAFLLLVRCRTKQLLLLNHI